MLSEAFSTWQTGTNHIWQILKFIKYIFIYPLECVSSKISKDQIQIPNKEAVGMLSQNQKDEFLKKVAQCVTESCEKIYDQTTTDDKHYITFEKFNPDIHGQILENLKKNDMPTSTSPPVSGISWVKEGDFKSLSKD